MQLRYVKTAAGLSEIQGRTRPLSRSVRNLLLVINDTQPTTYWLDSVKGISEDDIGLLEAEGLIEPAKGTSSKAASTARPSARPVASETAPEVTTPAPAPVPVPVLSQSAVSNDGEGDWSLVQQTIQTADYSHLYNALTSQGKAQLGLMKGFRFVLEVEKCNGIAELQALARSFVEQLRNEQGMNAVRKFSDALHAPA